MTRLHVEAQGPSSSLLVQTQLMAPTAQVAFDEYPEPPPLPAELDPFPIATASQLHRWKVYSQSGTSTASPAATFEGRTMEALAGALLECLEWFAAYPTDLDTFSISHSLSRDVSQATIGPHVHTFLHEGSFTVYVLKVEIVLTFC
jgi:hypothetical protein